MAIYSLHEMAGLLKTGLWQGGEVEKLGYIFPVAGYLLRRAFPNVPVVYSISVSSSKEFTLSWCGYSTAPHTAMSCVIPALNAE